MKVAVVQNRTLSGVNNKFGEPCFERYSERTVLGVAEALRRNDHEVLVCEGDKNLLVALQAFMPPDPELKPTGMVFNMAYGIQGNCRYTHVPAMLEMAGVPYTGSTPLGHALSLDKVVTKRLLREAGIPTPNYRVLRRAEDSTDGLRFPVVVKPRHESTSFGLELVTSRGGVGAAVEAIVAKYQQEALVEEYVAGREVCVALLGNDAETNIFPLVEQDFGERSLHLVTWDDKMHKVSFEPKKICPAPVPEPLAGQLGEIALATFRACQCQDYARVDIRLDAEMNPFVLEINSMASLGPTGSYVLAAKTAGYDFDALVNGILDVAHRRYFAKPLPSPRPEAEQLPDSSKRRAALALY